jgi:hypothetical protein
MNRGIQVVAVPLAGHPPLVVTRSYPLLEVVAKGQQIQG